MSSPQLTSLRPSFYGAVAEIPREDLLRAYREFLERRNGTMDFQAGYSRREAWLKEAQGWSVQHEAPVDAEAFNRAYKSTQALPELTAPLVALLAFVKMNAGEAYGVEVLSRQRQHLYERPDLFYQVERLLSYEETYHTRILLSATRHFGVQVEGAFRPPLSLKLLIGTLAHVPRAAFHPVLLGAEIAGVFNVNWMLKRVGEVYRGEPALREAMERRLIEILVDEVGHIAFNRMAVGPLGLTVARHLAGLVVQSTRYSTPEICALGMDENEMRKLGDFDLHHLPEEVLRRACFV